MKRALGTFVAAAAIAAAGVAAPAAAHFIEVDNSGKGAVNTHRGVPFAEVPFGWVGGDGMPAHMGGLNTACYALREPHNPSVVDIWGPGGPNCEHGS